MKKNFYLIEAYFLGYTATFIFFRYFILTRFLFYDILYKIYMNLCKFIIEEAIILGIVGIFLILKKKYKRLENNKTVESCMYIFIFMYIFFRNYMILR
ncbi:MAG: hypothetical protein Q4D53_04390 [Leptotrichiaceae bacterium]|nr:hypothetical protein [Leptotrichiaceae bacterium]